MCSPQAFPSLWDLSSGTLILAPVQSSDAFKQICILFFKIYLALTVVPQWEVWLGSVLQSEMEVRIVTGRDRVLKIGLQHPYAVFMPLSPPCSLVSSRMFALVLGSVWRWQQLLGDPEIWPSKGKDTIAGDDQGPRALSLPPSHTSRPCLSLNSTQRKKRRVEGGKPALTEFTLNRLKTLFLSSGQKGTQDKTLKKLHNVKFIILAIKKDRTYIQSQKIKDDFCTSEFGTHGGHSCLWVILYYSVTCLTIYHINFPQTIYVNLPFSFNRCIVFPSEVGFNLFLHSTINRYLGVFLLLSIINYIITLRYFS